MLKRAQIKLTEFAFQSFLLHEALQSNDRSVTNVLQDAVVDFVGLRSTET
jgi:hypothetical protein